MNTAVKTALMIDKAGRVVIPKAVRDELQLDPGDTLELEAVGDSLTLRPVRPSSPLRKVKGVWVHRTGNEIPASLTDQVLADIRERRF
jgi:AbrB family looped-hinge helix DNA binding protein